MKNSRRILEVTLKENEVLKKRNKLTEDRQLRIESELRGSLAEARSELDVLRNKNKLIADRERKTENDRRDLQAKIDRLEKKLRRIRNIIKR